ncbi:hypothetical protein ACU61A_28420 [Pseudonocardia sichuanensis]
MIERIGLTCQHCDFPIEYDPYKREWVHAESRLFRCDPRAETPRAFPAPPRSRDRGPRSPWDGRVVCPDCQGRREVLEPYAATSGTVGADGPCRTCEGTGRLAGPPA